MSRRFLKQFANSLVLGESGVGGVIGWGTTVPADTTPGWAPGALFMDIDAAAGSQVFINEGTLASADFNVLAFGAAGLLATATEINRAADVSTRVVTLATSTSITETLHEGKILLMTGTGSAFTQTLPAATGSGGRYKFIVGAVNTSNHVMTALAGDLLHGTIWQCSSAEAPDLGQPWISLAASSNIKVTLNGTTQGGLGIGDWVEFVDIATDKWAVSGMVYASGAEATPFST